MSGRIVFTDKDYIVYTVPINVKNVKITCVGGGSAFVCTEDVGYTLGPSVPVTKTFDSINAGEKLQITIGKGGGWGNTWSGDGQIWSDGGNYDGNRYSGGDTSIFCKNRKYEIYALGAGRTETNPNSDRTLTRLNSLNDLTIRQTNGTGYGGTGVYRQNEIRNATCKEGQWGAVIIEYDDATAPPPVDPTPTPQPPSPGHSSVDWTFPDLSSDPRFILSRFTRIIDIAEQIATNCLAIGDIYNNPVISIGGRYNLPIPDSMKVSRHRHDAQSHSDTLPTRAQWAASAEKPLSVNNINAMINTFNSFNNSVSGYCPDILATGGTDLIDTISPDQVATFHFFYQVRDKFARWEAYINNHMGWWDGNDLCARSCQVTCQTACQAACQGCNNSTCHNQNCGGWS